jgi:type IV pilus assembly protein PilM
MASSQYVWGIDIGKCSLKALRCRLSPTDPHKLIAEAYDCIEYPMMLTQPEADAPELVRAALAEFVGRNQLAGDRVAVSAPGQSGLAKFIKLPPLEAKKIPDIVKYEANQQIPFPLDQVVWDWQRLGSGIEEGGFVMDAEVALFAMKREQVAKALAPFNEAGIEVDMLQLSPIALANLVMFDLLPDPATLDPDNPPASVVLVTMGVDSTDLVITNGFKIWQRSMPIGGGSFTKAIVQELKYTYAKAEKEKRNAIRATDPKAVFKAMRPVFNQFSAELQRSLNFFSGSDRSAKIGKVYLLGNAAKLRGLSDFVAKQLQLEVHRLEKFNALEGPVLSAPAFRENRMGFAVAYGLALQATGGSAIRTNLLPREITRDRIIAAKRPWMVAALVALLVAGLLNFSGWFVAAASYHPESYQNAFSASDAAKQRSMAAKTSFEEAAGRLQTTAAWERYLIDVHERRFQTLDLVRAFGELLPFDPEGNVPDNPADRNEIHVESFDMEYVPDLAKWFQGVERDWKQTLAAAGKNLSATPPPPVADPALGGDPSASPPPEEGAVPPADPAANPLLAGPTGPGWVVQIVGHHFHNEDRHKPKEGEQYVRETLVRGLLGDAGPVTVSAGPKAGQKVQVSDLGIGFPVIVQRTPVMKVRVKTTPQPLGSAMDPSANPTSPEEDQGIELKQYRFMLQFVWQPTVPGGSPRPAAPAAPPAAAAPSDF